MNQTFAVGRRKTAIARARISPGKGEIIVNGKPVNSSSFLTEMLRITNTLNKFSISAKVTGGGLTGQMGAVVLAVARALVKIDPKFKAILRKKGFMTRDPRAKERKKPGLMGARKQKSSPKR